MDENLIGRIRTRIGNDARRTGDGDFLRMPADFRACRRREQPLLFPVYEILGMDHPSSRDWRRCDDAWESIAEMMEDWLGRCTFREEHRRAAG